jgi:hypothetical protein
VDARNRRSLQVSVIATARPRKGAQQSTARVHDVVSDWTLFGEERVEITGAGGNDESGELSWQTASLLGRA